MKPLETSFYFNDDCDVLVVQKATRSAKYNDSSEQGHCFLLTNAEIWRICSKIRHEISGLCEIIADILKQSTKTRKPLKIELILQSLQITIYVFTVGFVRVWLVSSFHWQETELIKSKSSGCGVILRSKI